jgi:hypothetical protein
MNDMRAVIIPKSDQLNGDDLIAGPRTITITRVEIRPGTEQPVSVFFEDDDGKPWKPCKTMARALVYAWGPDAREYTGRAATLYREPTVKWGGLEVGGIRISHLSHIDRDMVLSLTATKGSKKAVQIRKLVEAPRVAATDAAAEWAAKFIAGVESAVDPGALESFLEARGKKFGELQAKRPELHAQCNAAVQAKLATWTAPTAPATPEDC